MPKASRIGATTSDPGVKDQILKVATHLFARQGYSATSLQSIVDEVGIRKPSLLYHFPSKEVLREAVMQEMLQQWQNRLPRIMKAAAAGSDSFDALFAEVTEYFSEDPNRARLLLREAVNRPDHIRKRLGQDFGPWMSLLSNAIEGGRKAQTVRDDVDPEAWLVEMLIMVIGTYATGSVWATAFPEKKGGGFNRQMSEIVRMARISLFPDMGALAPVPEPDIEKERSNG